MGKQVRPLQQWVMDAEVKLLKQQEQLQDTEQTISDLGIVIAALWKKIWPSFQASPRIQPTDEKMFSANEEKESRDDISRGHRRWFTVVKL